MDASSDSYSRAFRKRYLFSFLITMGRTEGFLGISRFDSVLALDETFPPIFRRIVLFACGAGVFIPLAFYIITLGGRLSGAAIFLSIASLCGACLLPTLSLGFWQRAVRYNPAGAFSGPFLSRLDLYLYEIVRNASRLAPSFAPRDLF